ncbi:MAG TPA: glycoside hydrolase family 3 C-terminal domain-containing protein [Prolixibacteraceae bacterium]|nr:glycoside hydrolase family 3 C-terminal domain-containing protein [Prolixibacteraceae bacterium]
MKLKTVIAVLSMLMLAGCSANRPVHRSALLQFDKKIDEIIGQMTLEEKVNMLHAKHMFVSAGVERLGIADMKYADGPFGIREEMQPDGWAGLGWETDKATFFPTGSALAATWSPELAYAYGTGMAREARLRGKDMILGPAINIQRIPTGGRTYEYLSEDPFLSARLAVGYTKGVQENGAAACLKHYALNNQENNRGTVNVIVGERAMREIYLPPFRAAVEEAGAFGVMAAYNKVNGWWCAENDLLLNKILRDDWGFAGMVISDWNGTHSTVDALKNGLNVEMPTKKFLGDALLDSVKAGVVPEELVNQRVREILRVRMAIAPIPAEEANKEITSRPPQQKIAYEVASKAIVLLKNEGELPLDLTSRPVIAVIGANAEQTMAQGGLGAGVKTLYEITPLQGLKAKIGDKAEIRYAQGYVPEVFSYADMFRRRSPEEKEQQAREKAERAEFLAQEAVEVAAKADIVLFMGGNNRSVETEGTDRTTIQLPSGQEGLLRKIAAVNPRIVTILTSGAPNDLRVVQPLSKALILSWFNGSEGGNALADVLTGQISPSGRLPFTLPVKLEDSPAYALGNYPQGKKGTDVFANLVSESGETDKTEDQAGENKLYEDPHTAYYSEESLVGYRWFDTKNLPVMYPFGHGLTYTSFEYSGLSTDREKYGKNDMISLTLDLKNTGSATADEVVQAYVHRINPSVEWPAKELKAFSRITLSPGESRRVTLEIPVRSLQYWDEKLQAWNDDLCHIELQVGASAGDIRLRKEVTLK